MYKQIIETCEAKFVPTVLTKEETLSYIKDAFMMGECAKITAKIEEGLPIDLCCKLVKNYQTKYIEIMRQDPEMAKQFTMDMWVRTMKHNQ